MNLIPVKVECHAGYRADEYPKCFYIKDEKYEITEVLDRWYQGDLNPELKPSDYFKVDTSESEQYILKHDMESDKWYLVRF